MPANMADSGAGVSVVQRAAQKKIASKPKPTPNAAVTPSLGTDIGMPSTAGLLGQAQSIVNAQVNPQIAGLNADISQAQTSTKEGIADIGKWFGQAGQSIGQSQKSVQGNTAGAINAIGQVYGGAGKQISNIYSQGEKGIAGELSRLGLQSVIPSSIAPSKSDSAFAQALTALQGANAKSIAKEMGTNTSGLISAIASEAAASGAQSKTEMQRSMTNVINHLVSQRNATEASKAGLTQQVLSGLQASAADQAYKRAQMGIAQQRLGIEASNAGGANALRNAQIGYYNARTANVGQGSSKVPGGMLGAQTVISQFTDDPRLRADYGNEIGNLTGAATYQDAVKGLNDYVNQFKLDNATAAMLRSALFQTKK